MNFRYTNPKTRYGHTFGDLPIGGWFRYDDEVYIKIEESQTESGGPWHNAVRLDDGELEHIYDEDDIEIYKGEVTLDESKFEE